LNGEAGDRVSPWRPRHHQTSQNAPLVERQISHVTITNRRHGLFGRQLELVSLETTRGRDFIVVRLPNGCHRSIRRNETDLAAPAMESHPSGLIPRVDVATLLTLMRHLRSTLAAPTEKVIRDEEAASDDVFCSVSSPFTAGSGAGGGPPLAEPSGGEEGTNSQDRSRAVVADAAEEQASKGGQSC